MVAPRWQRRYERVATHLVPRGSACASGGALCQQGQRSAAAEDSKHSAELLRLFGPLARCSGPLAASGAGRRYTGIDLASAWLSAEQAEFLLDAVARWRIVCIAGQDLARFTLQDFERIANHFGAPYPHPSNFTRDGVLASEHGPTDGAVEWVPFADRRAAGVDAAFPGQLQCLTHQSPAVLIASNLATGETRGDGAAAVTALRPHHPRRSVKSGGGNWHTDIEYDPLPLSTSMFYCHRAPTSRESSIGTWVEPDGEEGERMDAPMVESTVEDVHGIASDPELVQLRRALPLNGETAFADTATAFAALPAVDQELLSRTRVRRRVNPGDRGTLRPLVVTNPRTGVRSLHSPVFDARPGVRPAVEVEGMAVEARTLSCLPTSHTRMIVLPRQARDKHRDNSTNPALPQDGRRLLDKLEAHCLQPRFRYDHPHTPGDVTIWDDLFATLHCIPPQLRSISSLGDARLLYRRGKKPPFGGSHLLHENDHFAKTGSGQTQGTVGGKEASVQDLNER